MPFGFSFRKRYERHLITMEPMIVLLPHTSHAHKHRPNSHAPEGDTNEARNEMAENMEKVEQDPKD